jgi:hypothetical protein
LTDAVVPLRVLVVGGSGAFGARLVAALVAASSFDIIVAGRDLRRAEAAIASVTASRPDDRTRLTALTMDCRQTTAGALAATGAFAVVDAAGPFQGGDYRLARAAIAAGVHYLDLADARNFVAGFDTLDDAARGAGVVALTGASTTPALTNAVLDELTQGWARVVRTDIAMSPGSRVRQGLCVAQSILSYAGRPVRVLADGAWRTEFGWGMTVRRRVPGLGRRWLSLVETPDLDIVPHRYRVAETALFRAGLDVAVLHRGLGWLSLLVKAGLVQSLAPWARSARAMAGLLAPFGGTRGYMSVEAYGYDAEGLPLEGRWFLLAQGGDGPNVPVSPAVAVLRAMAAGALAPGARACVGAVPLAAIEAELARYRITTTLQHGAPQLCLYRRVLGEAFDAMPAQVQHMHSPGWRLRARGRAQVDGPAGPLAAIVAAIFRLPPAGQEVRLDFDIVRAGGQEKWRRVFADRPFASVLSAGKSPGRLVERFGPFSFEMDLLTGSAGVLGMTVRSWRIGWLPMPRFLAPRSAARERVDDQGRFRFDVELKLPLGLGRLVRYRGWLVPK